MLSYEKNLSSPQINVATLEFNGHNINLKTGFHLIGKNCNNIQINDQSVDEKHALICIMKSGQHLLVDLESKMGCYIEDEKVKQSCTITNKISFIRLGNVSVKYTILNQSDSGFLDSKASSPEKDTSEIVASSPENVRNKNGSRIRNRYRRKNLTSCSTPNSKHFGSSSSNEDIGNDNIETDSKINQLTYINPNRVNEEDNDESFIVPETQPFELNLLTKKRNINIFDTIVDENVKEYINDMSREDDYYVPETQEIFANSKKLGSDEMVFINTQDFNASENSNSNSNDTKSENLCANFEKSINNISLNSIDFAVEKKIKENVNETEEMIQLKWKETEYTIRSNCTTPDIDFASKNKEKNSEKSVDKVNAEFEREDSTTPDLVFDNNNVFNQPLPQDVTEINNQCKETIETIPNKFLIPPSVKSDQNYNDYMDDENLLIPTQPFPFIDENCSPKFQPKTNFYDNDYDLLEETQLFIDPFIKKRNEKNSPIKQNNEYLLSDKNTFKRLSEEKFNKSINKPVIKDVISGSSPPLSKSIISSSKKSFANLNNLNKNKLIESDEESMSTQVFVVPKKSFNENKFKSTKPNLSFADSKQMEIFNEPSLCDPDATQAFILNEIEKENKKSHANDIVEKNLNGKRSNKALEVGNKQEINDEPVTKKKVTSSKKITKTSTNSSVSSYENINSPIPTASAKSITSKDAAFMLDVCTPSIDLIKLPVAEQGYLNAFKNIKKAKNRIYLEETDEEDEEIIELQKILDKDISKENDNKSTSKSKQYTKSKTKKKLTESVTCQLNAKTAETELEQEPNKKLKSTKMKPKIKRKSNEEQKAKSLNKNTISKMNVDLKNPNIPENLPEIQNNRKTRNKSKSNSTKSELSNVPSEYSFKTTTCSTRSSRSSNKNKMTLTFTKVNEDKYSDVVQNIGYTIVKNPEEAGLIITNNEISRTWKFLIGLAKGIPIISVDWLDRIKESNFSFVPYDIYYVKDKKAEKKFNFRLKDTLNLASKSKKSLFDKLNFLITENTVPPKSELERIIQCAGGVLVDSIEKFSDKDLYVVSDRKDSKQWSNFRNSLNNVKIIKVEGVLLSIMQHKIRFDDHIF